MYILLFFVLLFFAFGFAVIIDCTWDLAKRTFNFIIDLIATIIVKIIIYIRKK